MVCFMLTNVVEKCLKVVNNKYELVLLAFYRTKKLCQGGKSVVSDAVNKKTIVSLEEIASGNLNVDDIRSDIKVDLKNSLMLKKNKNYTPVSNSIKDYTDSDVE